MSPPIRDGSGSSIGSIRLGDGSEISEVRTGAGDVLFSAFSIPNSGDLYHALLPNYLSSTYSQGNSVTDWETDDASASLTPTSNGFAPTYESSLVSSDGAASATGQSGASSAGANLEASGLGALDASDNGFCLAVLLRKDTGTGGSFGGIFVDDVGGANNWMIRYDQGNYGFTLGSGSGTRETSVTTPADNNPHTVILSNISGGIDMYLDGGAADDSSATNPSFSTTQLGLFQYESGGGYYNFGGEIGAALAYQSGKTQSEVGDIHNFLTSL